VETPPRRLQTSSKQSEAFFSCVLFSFSLLSFVTFPIFWPGLTWQPILYVILDLVFIVRSGFSSLCVFVRLSRVLVSLDDADLTREIGLCYYSQSYYGETKIVGTAQWLSVSVQCPLE